MAEVTLSIGGYSYQLACRDGEEAHLRRLGEIVDAKSAEARAAVGNASETRQLLLSALLLADERIEEPSPQTAADPDAAVDRIAVRLEELAERLEKQAQTA